MAGLAHMLLGALLVAVGVIAGGIADRIRARVSNPRERARSPSPATIDVGESHRGEPARAAASNRRRGRPAPAGVPNNIGVDDVIAALVAAGYKRPIATEAALGCSEAERASIEEWARAALRRCAKGAAS